MSATVQVASPRPVPGWLAWWRRELRPFPGRLPMTIRMVVVVSLVTMVSMALQVPFLAFSAFYVFFVTKENRVLTLFTGVLLIVGVTVATMVTLLLYNYTFDHPELRLPAMAGFIFVAMFFARTFVIGPLGFIIGFLSALMQTIAENAPNTDALVRGQLWLWAAVVYPVVLTVIINQILLPADPWTALIQSFDLRLNAAAAALERILRTGSVGGQINHSLLDLATRGSGIMLGLLNFAEMKDPRLKHRHPFLVESIAAAGNLANTTATLEFRDAVPLPPEDVACARGLLANLAELKAVLPKEKATLLPRPCPPTPAVLPQLREVQFAVESIRDSLIRGASDYSSTAAVSARKPLFSADAFTNPSHLRFALKVTLAGMICYLVYSALAWPGLNTAFITCCFVALGTTGATIYRSWLRIFGCLVGGSLAFLAILFLIPQMESITSLVLLTAVVSALFAWVAAGSDRIAYAGLQAAFAFYLALFQGFEPETNLTTIRDRIIGILLGTVTSAIVFRCVWPEHAADDLRRTLGRMLDSVSKLLLMPQPGVPVETDGHTALSLHRTLSQDLDSVLVLSEQAAVENIMFRHARSFSPAGLARLTAHIQALGLITTALFRRTKLEEWQRLAPEVQVAETALRAEISDYLKRVADYVREGRRPESCPLESALATWNRAAAQVTDNDRPRLVRRLVGQIREIA
jgi:multidrug resistance protein MdtO